MTSKKILFDTNVLLYAQDQESEFFLASQRAHEKVINGEWFGCLSIQNVVEFLSLGTSPKRVAHPLTRKIALLEIQKYYDLPEFSIIVPNSDTLAILLSLKDKWKTSQPQHIYDLQLASTMLSNGIGSILTANTKDFLGLPGIEVVDLKKISSLSRAIDRVG